MIENLIWQVITLLRAGFSGLITNPDSHIKHGPIRQVDSDNLPEIAIHAGPLDINIQGAAPASTQPKPQEKKETIPADHITLLSPHVLSKIPLRGTMICKLVQDPDGLDEQRTLLTEGMDESAPKDYLIDYNDGTITFYTSLPAEALLLLQYSFAGIYTQKEFQQAMIIEVYDVDGGQDDNLHRLDRLVSLTAAMIITNHDQLLETYNITSPTEHISNSYLSRPTLSKILLKSMEPDYSKQQPRWLLNFEVSGQFKAVKEIPDTVGIIEEVRIVQLG